MSAKVALIPSQAGWISKVLGRRTRLPRIASGHRVVAVGDIHGRRDLLVQLLDKIEGHDMYHSGKGERENTLVFLGDYVDRGPDSRGVVDELLALGARRFAGWRTVFLRGNHEQSLLDFLDDPWVFYKWRNFGGAETLLSYGVRPPQFEDDQAVIAARDAFADKLPPEHLAFFQSLQYMHEDGDFVFVHAGIRPGIPLSRQRPEDLLWIRDDFLKSELLMDKIIVHGHTPGAMPVQKPNRLCLDTGAHATGCLTAVLLEEEHGVFLSTAKAGAQTAA